MTAKKITSYVLAILVVACTLIALLSVWNIISLHDVMARIFKSMFIIFIASLVTLFIFNVVIKNDDKDEV